MEPVTTISYCLPNRGQFHLQLTKSRTDNGLTWLMTKRFFSREIFLSFTCPQCCSYRIGYSPPLKWIFNLTGVWLKDLCGRAEIFPRNPYLSFKRMIYNSWMRVIVSKCRFFFLRVFRLVESSSFVDITPRLGTFLD